MEPTYELVSSQAGIYAQESLATNYPLFTERGEPYPAKDIAILLDADNEEYWEVLEYEPAYVKQESGTLYRVEFREGDIIAVHVDAEWSEDIGWFLRGANEIEYTVPEWSLYAFEYPLESEPEEDVANIARFCDMRTRRGKALARGRYRVISEPYFSGYNDVHNLGDTVVDILIDETPIKRGE